MKYKVLYKNLDTDEREIEDVNSFVDNSLITIDKIYDEGSNLIYSFYDRGVIKDNYKYIKTYESFTNTNNKKYYDVVFNNDTIFTDVYNGDGSDKLDVSVKKGDKVRLYVNMRESNEDKLVVKGFRPLLDNKSNENVSVSMSNLWNGGFILDKEIEFDIKNASFNLI